MRVVPLRTTAAMQPWIETWNRLAGDRPFLRWEWLGTWWEHYGRHDKLELLILAVEDECHNVVGFAPWYLEPSSRSIQFLGSGKVCTDYLTLLCDDSQQTEVARAIATWLQHPHAYESDGKERPERHGGHLTWDQVELIGGMSDDARLHELSQQCQAVGLTVHQQRGPDIYYTPLPSTLDDYLKQLSRNGRRQVRLQQRQLDSDSGYQIREFHQPAEITDVWPTLIDLHQRRRHSVGDTGCFDHPPFGDFLYDAASRMAQAGCMEVVLLEHDAKPIAFQLVATGGKSYYIYQSGIDPDEAERNPGNMVILNCFKQALERGFAEFDFLRGDEAYKLRWGGIARRSTEWRIIAPRVTAQLKYRFWLTGTAVKSWIKSHRKHAS